MKQLFKPGERVYVHGVSEKIKNAIIARFEADGWEPYYNDVGYIGIYGESERDCTNITIEECLFRDKPAWVVDVRKSGLDYCWSNGRDELGYFTGGHTISDSIPGEIIYTRKPEKPWHETGELPPGGEVVQTSFGKVVVNFLNHKFDQICVTDLEFGISYLVNKSQIRPIPKTKKIDMSKFAGTDVWLAYEGRAVQAKALDSFENTAPAFDEWNHWTGDEDALEGFNYEFAMAIQGQTFIKILRIKDGWELP